MTLRLPPTPTQDRLNEVYPVGTLVLDESLQLYVGDGDTAGGVQPFGHPELDYVKLRGDAGQDMNAEISNNVMDWQTQVFRSGRSFAWSSGNSSRITVNEDCDVIIIANVVLTSAGVRQGSSMKLRVNGTTDLDEEADTGYIRNTGGHVRASYHFSVHHQMKAGEFVEVLFDRSATSATSATTDGTKNSFSLTRIG